MANKKVSEMAVATQVNNSDLVMIVQDGENKSVPSLKFKSEKTIISKDSLPIGSVIEWYSDEIPDNWLICDGSAVSRSLYNDLYKVLGTRYGAGNGSSTFNLPDLKDRIPIGKNTSNNNFNVLGKTGGEEQHQMTIYELPKHRHAINTANGQGDMEWGYQFLYDNSTAAYNGMMQYIGESQPFNILQPYIVCHYIIKAINPDPVQTADEIKVIDDSLPIGCTVEWHSDIEPEDWLICNGQTVDRNEYAELFEVLGTRYGNGDGTTTFALPDLRGRVPVGKNGLDSDFDILGKTLGEKTHKLAAEEMPIHRHRGIYNEDSWSIIVNQKTSGNTVGYATPEGPVRGKDIVMSTEIAGGDQSHNNIQPSLIVNFIIKAKKKTKIGAKVINDLTNTSETDALSAKQGKILNDKINELIESSQAALDSFPIGAIVEYGSGIVPEGFMLCNGAAVSRTEYAILFDRLGTVFGAGDGSTTFNLPDLRGKVPVGLDIADDIFNELGREYGEKKHTMTVKELVTHTHKDGARSDRLFGTNDGGNYSCSIMMDSNNCTRTPASCGSSQPFNVVQPSLVLNYIIKVKQIHITPSTVVNNLASDSAADSLSANQGRILNEKIEALSVGEGSQRHIVTMYTQTVNVQAESDTKINASSRYVKVGSKLSVSNGNVKIGAGVSKVLVSAHVLLDEAQVHHHFLYVYCNDNLWHRLDSYGRYDSIDMAPSLLPVSEGDEIGLVVRAGSTTTVYESSYLTVEVIE